MRFVMHAVQVPPIQHGTPAYITGNHASSLNSMGTVVVVDPELQAPGLQASTSMVTGLFYLLGLSDGSEAPATRPKQTLGSKAEIDDNWQRLLDDPDCLFTPADVIETVYEQFLSDVVAVMAKNECGFKEAVAMVETAPSGSAPGVVSAGWGCFFGTSKAAKAAKVSLLGPPPASTFEGATQTRPASSNHYLPLCSPAFQRGGARP